MRHDYSYEVCGRAFVGCPRDAEPFHDILQKVWRDLPVPGQRPDIVHWKKDYDPVATPGGNPDQFKIARTSDSATTPVFILFARTIGTPVRPPAEGWGKLRTWLDEKGWSFIALVDEHFKDPNHPPDGKIPLSGTMFELFDALSTGDSTDLRIYDLRALVPPPQSASDDERQQEKWCDALLAELARTYSIRAPRTESEYRHYLRLDLRAAFKLAPLDPLVDELPGLAAIDDEPMLFARDSLIREMNDRIFRDNVACTTVLGVSGAGKSSFLRSGLIRRWFDHSPPGAGTLWPTHALLFEPDLLVLDGGDPLDALFRLLTGMPVTPRTRVVGPFPEPLATTLAPLPPASTNLQDDLVVAFSRWAELTHGLAPTHKGPHRVILICDQAEQIEVHARQQAQKRASDTDEPQEPTLDPVWLRFTAFLALLAGLLPDKLLPKELAENVTAASGNVRFQLILGLHRLSALAIWPIEHARLSLPFEVPPLASLGDWNEVIDKSCKAYGLTLAEALLKSMAKEAAGLAKRDQEIQRLPNSEMASADPTRASILPLVRGALQRLITEWRSVNSKKRGTLVDRDMLLDEMHYGNFSSIEQSIEILGEDAWQAWQQSLATQRGLDMTGYVETRILGEECDRRFNDIFSGLVDVIDASTQELTLLSKYDDPRVKRQDALVQPLYNCKLLTSTEVSWDSSQAAHAAPTSHLRLAHRTILKRWSRARQWVETAGPRLELKNHLKHMANIGVPSSRWSLDELDTFSDLALNWIGSREGKDREYIDYLHTGLSERLDPAKVNVQGPSRIDRLPFAAASIGDLALALRLLARCSMHPSWPQKAGPLLIGFAEAGSAVLTDIVLDHPSTPLAIVNWVDPETGAFPLLMAAQNGHDDIVRRLLDANADPNEVNDKSGTFPLLMAAEGGHDDVVRRLLGANADPNKVDDKSGNFPLLMPAQNGHGDIVRRLLGANADPNKVNDKTGTFPLLLAAQNGHDDIVRRLLDANADPNKVDPSGGTFPLLQAAQQGHVDIVRRLLDANADPNKVNDKNGTFPLLQAAQEGHDDIVRRLLDTNVDPNKANDKTGYFPLLQAAQQGHDDIVRRLLDANADPNKINNKNGTFPLLQAAQNGHEAIVRRLLDAKADPNKSNDKNGYFPLLMAAHKGYDDIVRRLLDANADPNKVNDKKGTFPLLMAAQSGHDDVVRKLLDANADPNKVNNKNGNFPLLVAALGNHVDIVQRLLVANADPNKVHLPTGATAYMIATGANYINIAHFIEAAGGSPKSSRVPITKKVPETLRDPVAMSLPSPAVDLAGLPVLGPWKTFEPVEHDCNALAEAVSGVFKDAGLDPLSFKVLGFSFRSALSQNRLDVVRMQFVVEFDRKLAFEVVFLLGTDLPPIVLAPGLDLDGVLRSLALRRILPNLREPESQKLLVSLFLTAQSTPLIPVLPEVPLPLPPGVVLGHMAEDTWRSWRQVSGRAGPQIELPWIDGRLLVRGRVLVPADGHGMRILDYPTILATDIPWHADRFQRNAQGRASGLWLLGEIGQ